MKSVDSRMCVKTYNDYLEYKQFGKKNCCQSKL